MQIKINRQKVFRYFKSNYFSCSYGILTSGELLN